jgi:hypothetical protein
MGEHVSAVLVAWFVDDFEVVLGEGVDSLCNLVVDFLWMLVICEIGVIQEDLDWNVSVSK